MVKAKKTARSWIDVRADIMKALGDVIGERYYVIEHTPAYNTGGYYDQDVPASNVMVSPYFDTEDEAVSWMNDHEPDEGKKLYIWKDKLYERTVRDWRYDYSYNRNRKN